MTLVGRKVWNVLLANAYNDLLNQDKFEIEIKYLLEMLSIDNRNIEYLRDVLRNLIGTVVEFNILEKDKSGDWGSEATDWDAISLLPRAGFRKKKKVCVYEFHKELKKRLFNPTMYAKISLVIQSEISSKHTLAIYELCVDYYFGNGFGETPFITLEILKKLLDVEKEKTYKKFKYLNRSIIKPAVREINEKTNLLVKVEYKKQGRMIVALKFKTKSKSGKDLISPKQIKREKELYDELVDYYQISNQQALRIIKNYDEKRIRSSLKYVKKKIDEGEIKNIGGFSFRAIIDNWGEKKSQFEIDKEEEKAANQGEIDRKKKKGQDEIEKGKKIYEEMDKDKQREFYENLLSVEKFCKHPNVKFHLETFPDLDRIPKATKELIFQWLSQKGR